MADWAGYLAAREWTGRVGPWLVWPAAAASWAALALWASGRDESRKRGSLGDLVSLAFLAAAFLLLVWYHGRIWATLPLGIAPETGAWLNAQLAAARGGSTLGPVDWAHPPRWLIPLWIEGEKFFFWTLVMALVVWVEGRRRAHRGYLLTLRLMMALQVTGMAVWDNPFTPPLPQFHAEILPWFTGGPLDQIKSFFRIYPRMRYYYNAGYMWLHPPMLFVAYATLAATFAGSLFTFRRAEPELDKSAYDYARIGYLLLTLGMLVGYPWAIMAWGPNWWWDPKIAASIMMWLLYSAYLHHRFVTGSHGGRVQVAALGVLCYASLVFTYFMSWYFPGEHTF